MPRPKKPKRKDLHTTLSNQAYDTLIRLAQGRPLGFTLDELIVAANKQVTVTKLVIIKNEVE